MSAEPMPTAPITGEMLAAVSREIVRIVAETAGKGPSEAKSHVCDDFLICIMKGGLTQLERTLVDADESELVRRNRLTYQRHMTEPLRGAVERITGRTVLTYQSQILFDPDYLVEIFLLTPGNHPAG